MPDKRPIFRGGTTQKTRPRFGQRGSAQRGYGGRWQKYREAYLGIHPLCVKCEAVGKTAAATVIDHIQEVSGPYDPLFWEPNNHQALCRDCHERKHGRKR